MADWAGVVSAVIAVVGLSLVVVQLRGATAASRAQATIQVQAAFLRSQKARGRLQAGFPLHDSLLGQVTLDPGDGRVSTWSDLDDLSDEDKSDAKVVVGALNDVAQYVVDGLALRSALQQYHTVFVRVGALLLPFLEQENAPVEGRDQARYGYRVVDLYNAGIAYHLSHHKHRGRELVLKRPAADGAGDVRVVLLHRDGSGVVKHEGFGSEAGPRGPRGLYRKWKLRGTVKQAERKLWR
jgi:type II secretory pathway pseudopilin PulG